MLDKMRALAPEEVLAVEQRASSNKHRYFAYLAYESGEHMDALRLLREGFSYAPLHWLRSRRSWILSAACISGLVLPARLHRALESFAIGHARRLAGGLRFVT